MKKIIAFILVAGMTLALLSGCGGSNNSGSSGNAQQSSGVQEAAAEPAEQAQEPAAEPAEQEQEPAAEPAEQEQEPAAEPAEQVQKLVAEPAEVASVPRMVDTENTYIILVRDASDDTPIQGVMVQFCSDTQCMALKTDENGAAVFEAEPGTYSAHVLRVPEGYEKNNETFEMTPENRTVQFALQKKGKAADGGSDGKEAASAGEYDKNSDVWEYPMSGLTLKVPERFKSCKGQLNPADRGETDYGSEIYLADIIYVARTDAEREEIEKKRAEMTELTPELKEAFDGYFENRNPALVSFMCIKGEKSVEDVLAEQYSVMPLKETGVVGKAGDYTLYYYQIDYSDYTDLLRGPMGEEMFEEFLSLSEELPSILAGVTVKEPVRPVTATEKGEAISFETTDLDGNAVKSADLFAGAKVTMINLWATWCTPCKNELPELEKLSKELEAKGCRIIGICVNANEGEDVLAEARAILENAGVTYTNVAATEEILDMLPQLAMPTTYFVDSEGRVLTTPVKGAFFEKYKERIEEALQVVGE